MTAKVLRVTHFHESDGDTATPASHAEAPQAGWDPHEVWRTRILAPRLAEARAESVTREVPEHRSLLDWFYRLKTS